MNDDDDDEDWWRTKSPNVDVGRAELYTVACNKGWLDY